MRQRNDRVVVILWVLIVIGVAAFWIGAGYGISLAFASPPKDQPLVCTYSGVIPNPDGSGATSSAICSQG
jgi:hypothetical protein